MSWIFLPLLIYMVIQAFVSELLYSPYGLGGWLELPQLLGTFLGAVLFCIIFFTEGIKNGKITKRDWKNISSVTDFSLLFGISVSLCAAGNLFVSMIPVGVSSYENTRQAIYGSTRWLQVLTIGIAAPAAEELIFRLYAFEKMKEYTKILPAILCSALYFGIYHGNLLQGVYGFLAGICLAYVMERFQSFAAPVFVHMLSNICSLIFTWTLSRRMISGPVIWAAFVISSGVMILFIYLIEKNSRKKEERL